jgi:sec-independent protein translocase protein TatB
MSFLETLIILLVAMIFLGPKRLPSAARKIGKVTGAIRRAGEEFRRQLLTMDQQVDQTLQAAQPDLDELLPTDEELAIMDGSAQMTTKPPSTLDVGTPPASSPDALWDVPPVPGGVLPRAPEVTPSSSTEEVPRG